jgi:hypothetical protein
LQALRHLLDGVSYLEQWTMRLDSTMEADTAICVFSPNVVERPNTSSMTYVGAFSYEVDAR